MEPQHNVLLLDELPIVQHSRWGVSGEKSEEQLACFQGFRTFRLEMGAELQNGDRRTNHLIALIEGKGEYATDSYDPSTEAVERLSGTLSSQEMLLVAINDSFSFTALTPVKGVVLSFDSLNADNDEPIAALIGAQMKKAEARDVTLYAGEALREYWNGMFRMVAAGAMSPWITRLKRKELFYYIDYFFEPVRKRAFLLPVLNQQNPFRSLVLNNCDKSIDTDRLVQLSGMCRTNFYRRFKQEFNMPIYRWMQMRRAHAVRLSAAEPGMNVQTLMERHQFSSASNFIRFCRMYYSCNPNELIRRVRAGLPLSMNGEEAYQSSIG